MIDPEKIPQYNGDLEQLEAAATGLKGNGSDIAATGAAIHSTFQGLSAFYDAPEAEQLFATTKPVADTAKTFGDDVGQVAKALSDYATEIRPIATKLKQLKADATTFVDSVKGSDDWKYDGHKVARNNDLLHQVDVAVAAFWDAERRAANKIDAIFHGTQYVTGDGSNKSNMYGYTADTLDHAKLPWGSSEQQAHHWYDFGHWIKSFVWDGMIVDGLWGTVKGLGGLVGFEGWDTFKNSWTGLADVVGGLGLYLVKPYDMLIGAVLGNKPDSPGEAREKAAFRNFGKSLLAWDEWGKNPARAAGTVAFNVLTFAAGPLSKLGAASKVGEAGEAAGAASTTAKIAGTLGKTGELIDPMTYLTKGVAKLPRISDIAAHLDKFKTGDIKGIDDLTKLHGTDLPEGSLKLPDNTVLHTDLPSHAHAPHPATPEPVAAHATTDAGHAHAATGGDVSHDAGHGPDTGPGHGHGSAERGTGPSHDGSSGDAGGPPDSGTHAPGAESPEPQGNLPDGSWQGPSGLKLDPHANATTEHFMARAMATEPHITDTVQSIAQHVDHGKLNGLEYRLKGEDSLKRKVATALLDDPRLTPERALGDIKDSLRYTVEVPTENYTHGVQQAVNELHAHGFENVTFKNTWDSHGYKGINSTWRDPATGQAFEVQFHTPESFSAKMDGHLLYEKERLPGISHHELAAIKAEQKDLFGKVPVPHDAGSIHLEHTVHHGDTDPVHLHHETGHSSVAGHHAAGTDPPSASGTSHQGGWGGAGWVTEPSEHAGKIYEEIRATPNKVDLPRISANTGIDESILRRVKSHLFRSQHDVPVGPGKTARGLFEPRDDIANLWTGAREGTLKPDDIHEFKALMAHEYVESHLMKAGLPYTHENPDLWARVIDNGVDRGHMREFPTHIHNAGAHDLAPNPTTGSFRHWRALGLEPPATTMTDDLSNVDDVVKDIIQELRSKGMNLK